MRCTLPLVLIGVVGVGGPAGAQELDKATVKASIDKGLAWLQEQQKPDGTFEAANLGGGMHETNYPIGRCALGTLTLLKCGVPPNDRSIQAAFAYMYAQPLEKTYGVAMLILAIEARYVPAKDELEKELEKKGYGSIARKKFQKKASPADRQKLQECVDWLVANRSPRVWRYPGAAQDGATEDNSNAQYAMLALKSASRMGIKVDPDVFAKVADYFVENQDPKGEPVKWFPVPAADGPIYDMVPPLKREKELEKAHKKADRDSKKGDGGETAERGEGSGGRPSGGSESHKMEARGWSYLPRSVSSQHNISTGSMTASGVAALCIAKSELERSKGWGPRREKVEQAIRDGCAWLSKYFITTANPTATNMTFNWKYYYLYGTERAGVLAGTYTFGAHDWWDEGALHLLKAQKSEGDWPDEAPGLSSFCDTCFALLFLKRATIPLSLR